tara:strand:- start:818 stop:1003 length:186 start_codon:yes stop_codon:yes gene_type:complete
MTEQGQGRKPDDDFDIDEPCDCLDQFNSEDIRTLFNTILWTCIGFGFGVVFGFVNPLGFGM